MTTPSVWNKDVLAGLFFIGIALCYVFFGRELEIGTATNMGPAYFPYVVSGLLGVLGLIVILTSLRKRGGISLPAIAWRPLIIILGAPVIFAVLIEGFGFVPALFTAIFFSTFAARPWHLWKSVCLSAAIVFFCGLVFIAAFGVPIPIAKLPV